MSFIGGLSHATEVSSDFSYNADKFVVDTRV